MKKIIYTLAVVLAGFGIQSCSLHEDTNIFDQSASERIDAVVAHDKEVLESATNGWKLVYYTGEEYTGGGYTYLCKFKNGSVIVAGDMSDGYQEAKSSYDIITDQSVVLTFNTFNELMHKFATPTSSSIDGEQGDYEFLIQKVTNDSIYLEGKKWGNKMVMTRVPENLSWEEHLDSITRVANDIRYNNKVMNGNDSIGYISLDDYTRRAVLDAGNDKADVPYFVTSKGVRFQSPITVNGQQISELSYNEDTHAFKVAGDNAASTLSVKGYYPPHYQLIDFYEGTWTLDCYGADADYKKTNTLQQYRIEFTYYNPIYLKGKINIDGLNFDLYFRYYRDKGAISLVQQYADDPTKEYSYANVAPVSFDAGGRFNWTGDLLGSWNEEANQVDFVWNKVGAAAIDSYVFLATNAAGSPVYNSDGQLIMLTQITYLTRMTCVK